MSNILIVKKGLLKKDLASEKILPRDLRVKLQGLGFNENEALKLTNLWLRELGRSEVYNASSILGNPINSQNDLLRKRLYLVNEE